MAGQGKAADGEIDGGEVIDGSLSVRDVARWVGTFEWPVGLVKPGECEVKWVQVAGVQVAGDFLLLSPTAPWPRDLVYTANGTGSETEFKVQACNRSGKDFAGATYTFNDAVLGF